MLREWKYRDYYHPNITVDEEAHKSLHAGKSQNSYKTSLELTCFSDHCLEMLRASSMCHADRSLTTFLWSKHEKPMLDSKRPPHICVNWDSLITSVKSRIVGADEAARIRNPFTV